MVLITVLTPLYNGIEFLEECVNSVIQQSFTDWEMLIAVNGHGADGGAAAEQARALAAKDARIRVLVQPPPIDDKVKSLNDAVTRAAGEWIALLDCDDVWHGDKLRRQVEALATGAAVIGTFAAYIGERSGSPLLCPGYVSPYHLLTCNHIINSSALVQRKFCTWRYPEGEPLEDYDLWMRIVLQGGQLYNVPEVLTYHRIHASSAFKSKGHDPTRLCQAFLSDLMRANVASSTGSNPRSE